MPVELAIGTPTPKFTDLYVLDGTTYTLSFAWNVRLGAWFVDVLNAQGDTVMIGGIRLVVDVPLVPNFTLRQPTGWFIAKDTSGKGVDPGLDDLGGRVRLLYVSKSDTGG